MGLVFWGGGAFASLGPAVFFFFFVLVVARAIGRGTLRGGIYLYTTETGIMKGRKHNKGSSFVFCKRARQFFGFFFGGGET